MKKSKTRVIGKIIWRILSPLFYYISPVLASKVLYILSIKKEIDLNEPKNFNEKLMWLKLFWQNPLVVTCADKYEVREYVTQCGYNTILPKIYGIYANAKDIDWENMPEKYVLKCNHGCGFNIICDGKNKLNRDEVTKKLDKWMKTRYVFEAVEIQYDKITPKIICEEYIETSDGILPNDYKIYCFNGIPKLTLVCTDRNTDLKLKFMDLNWNEMPIGDEDFLSNDIPRKPKWYDEMLKISQVLSKPFPFVRIDFYDRSDKPIFGEMTFTPAGCAARYYNEEGLKILGDMITLPKI